MRMGYIYCDIVAIAFKIIWRPMHLPWLPWPLADSILGQSTFSYFLGGFGV